MWTKHRHHRIFSRFRRWSGFVPAGFDVDFLGTRHKTAYFTMWPPQPEDRYASPDHPPFDEEYFEWIDLLEAIASASGQFTMLELGAGFGRWTARAAAAAQQLGLPYFLTAIEAEPTHFKWLNENLKDNSVSPEHCSLIQAAVTGNDGTVGFQVGDPASSYGQSIGGATQVKSISLSTVLRTQELIDLIDMDVQGAELEILEAATGPLAQKVKRVHVETHSGQLHAGVYRLFRNLRWIPHFLFEGNAADTTPFGRIDFQGGTQSWLNPVLCGRDVILHAGTYRNSVAWRAAKLARIAVDRVAPPGTFRRKAFNATLSGLGSKYRRASEDAARRPMGW